MKCEYYQQKKCLSCQQIEFSYLSQLQQKQIGVEQALLPLCREIKSNTPYSDGQHGIFLAPVQSAEHGFRNKAKMVVTGTVEKPILGILNGNEAVDLCECPLYSSAMKNALQQLKIIIKQLGLVPYNINKKRGELKFVILTESQTGLMLRFVLQSTKFVAKIKLSLPLIQSLIPDLHVLSVNIQPIHAAILEGEEEIILTANEYLPVALNHLTLFIRPKSFFQTNTQVAEKLYATASYWIDEIDKTDDITAVWDLFCGVGGFGLHCVTSSLTHKRRALVGIEISQEAIECAKMSADLLGISTLEFKSLDATQFALAEQKIPDLILLNPPRRGIGDSLVSFLQHVSPKYILYSSCNLSTLALDIKGLSNYQIQQVQLFDMFPHTSHMEILVLLKNIQR